MELGLKGKAALVTGASEGIGMAIARKLSEEGVRVRPPDPIDSFTRRRPPRVCRRPRS